MPAAGFCDMTLPAGTVAENPFEMLPSCKPAALMAAMAAEIVSPVTAGVRSYCGVRLDMTRVKKEPGVTTVPAGGFCETTSPGAMVDEETVTGWEPRLSRAALSVAIAAAWV